MSRNRGANEGITYALPPKFDFSARDVLTFSADFDSSTVDTG